MPVALMYNLGNDTTKFNWNYYSVPQKQMNNRNIYCPRGKGWLIMRLFLFSPALIELSCRI